MNIEQLIQQKSDEKVIFFLRRHSIVFLGVILLSIFIMLVPIGVWYLINLYQPELYTNIFSDTILKLIASAYYLLVWIFLFSNFVDYYLDAWVVTTDRIINIEQHGLFNRTVAELDLVNIQDVTSEVHGILPFFLNYGNVSIQTAAEKERFLFEQVPKPEEVRKRLLVLVEEEKRSRGVINL